RLLPQRNRGAPHGRPDTVGRLARLVRPRIRQQHDELVAGVAADDSRGRTELAERTSDDAEHRIALEMSVPVVDLLELIDVDHDKRHRREWPALAENGVRDV